MRRILCCLIALTTACDPASELPEPPALELITLYDRKMSDNLWGASGPAVVDSTGAAIVGFPTDGVVLALDPAGQTVWRHGRTGGGPGEFMNIGAISVDADTIYVADYAQQRFVTLSLHGDVIDTAPARLPGFGGFHRLQGGDLAFSPFPAAASLLPGDETALLRLDPAGVITDTLATFALNTFQISVADGSDRYFVGQPLSDDPIVRVSSFGDGIVRVDRRVNDAGRSLLTATVRWIDLAGDTVATQSVPFPAAPLSRSTRDSILAQIDSALPPVRSVRKAAADLAFLPRNLPPVTRAVVGGGGEVWLRGAGDGGGDVTWISVAAETGVMGSVRLAESSRILASHGCYLLISQRGALDVESIVLATICPN